MRCKALFPLTAFLALGCNAIFGMNDLEFRGDDGGAPTITSIDGDGTALGIEDLTGATGGLSGASFASHRFQTKWVIQGSRLDTVTECGLVQTSGGTASFGASDGLEFETGGTAMQRNLALPAALVAGAFTLTLGNGFGEAAAQVYVLQGEKGDPGEGLACDGTACTLTGNQDLIVNGSVSAESGDFASLTASTAYWLPECPVGYARDTSTTDIVLCAKGDDEIVKVGDFWIDRYEASLWSGTGCAGTQYGATGDDYPATFPDKGDWSAAVYACSLAGVTPSAYATWFQAQQACILSGKRLCSNEEWQAAAAGTPDPGDTEIGTQCRVASTNTAARATGSAGGVLGGADSCVSLWGAEDMIGNLWEWVSQWGQAGNTWVTAAGAANESTGAWGEIYGNDSTWNVNGNVFHGATAAYADALPFAALRGGHWKNASGAGAFAIALDNAPSQAKASVGLRCCLGR